jgi:asparagine synthase (glutamine-hydrolysing)
VLNRRKVGFDTPAQRWITEQHLGFVRDLFASTRSRQRGFWNSAEVEKLLAHAGSTRSFDILWKLLSIEVWASVFLDGGKVADLPSEERVANVRTAPESPHGNDNKRLTRFGHLVQECRELGVKGTLARGLWEVQTRTGLVRLKSSTDVPAVRGFEFPTAGSPKLPFADPLEAGAIMRDLMPREELSRLSHLASEATRGRILCFSRWMADYSNPIDWHRDPTNGFRYSADAHWSRVLRNTGTVDVKFAWEAARFPHTYAMARAAACNPASAPDLGEGFASQLVDFTESNPAGKGVHWFSGQEVAVRIMAWLFGYHVFSSLGILPVAVGKALGTNLGMSGAHLLAHISYARDSVYNNHLLSEALGLYIAGRYVPGNSADRWREDGMSMLIEQADRQIYSDGAYIQQSHNYHRVAMQLYLWVFAFARVNGERIPSEWTAAMERSLDFLFAHQNPADGSLPNYGANDGSLPIPLSSCDIPDFRPVLQALSIATRAERLYEPGPWDEEAVWYFGASALDLPLRKRVAISRSLMPTGYHVLRGNLPESFGAFRCGNIPDRFSQIDMLHLDLWWNGHNVLVDGGTYRYNGAPTWHNHFLRTECHNTLNLDGRDQMLHFRQFKTLFRTEARLLNFEDNAQWGTLEGEHYGYRREQHCIHRRAILFLKDDVWIVADTVKGEGVHTARIQWLGGDFPWTFDAACARLVLKTPAGPFSVSVFDEAGVPSPGTDVQCGSDHPPRGWQSRSYGEKVAVPSLAATATGPVPLSFVTILCVGIPEVSVLNGEWTVLSDGGPIRRLALQRDGPLLVGKRAHCDGDRGDHGSRYGEVARTLSRSVGYTGNGWRCSGSALSRARNLRKKLRRKNVGVPWVHVVGIDCRVAGAKARRCDCNISPARGGCARLGRRTMVHSPRALDF